MARHAEGPSYGKESTGVYKRQGRSLSVVSALLDFSMWANKGNWGVVLGVVWERGSVPFLENGKYRQGVKEQEGKMGKNDASVFGHALM